MSLVEFTDDRNPTLQYSGEWETVEDSGALNGTLSMTISPGSTISYAFSGNLIVLLRFL